MFLKDQESEVVSLRAAVGDARGGLEDAKRVSEERNVELGAALEKAKGLAKELAQLEYEVWGLWVYVVCAGAILRGGGSGFT